MTLSIFQQLDACKRWMQGQICLLHNILFIKVIIFRAPKNSFFFHQYPNHSSEKEAFRAANEVLVRFAF